jgi:PE family
MSYVLATPELISAAATDLAAIGSTLDAAYQAATNPTMVLVPAAADEVSGAVAHLFSAHGAGFQALAGKAVAFHDQLVENLKAGAASYTGAEAVNASALGDIWSGVLSGNKSPVIALVETLESSPLGFLLTPVFAILGISLFLGFLLALGFLGTLLQGGFLGQFGL